MKEAIAQPVPKPCPYTGPERRQQPAALCGSNLAALRELTTKLTDYSTLFIHTERTRYSLVTNTGGGFIEGLLKIPAVAVSVAHYDAESLFPEHTHPEDEYVIVFGGRMAVDMNGMRHQLRAGFFLFIPGNSPHNTITEKESCDFIVITVPANKEFPDAT